MAKLAGKYGDALFGFAVERGKTDSMYEEAKAVREVLLENEELSGLLNHPGIDTEDKIRVTEEIFRGRVSDELAGFIVLVVRKNKYMDIVPMLDCFIDKVREYRKIGVVYITTPAKLSEKRRKDVEKRLLETTSYNELEMKYIIDARLIGGMIIRIGDRIADSSIKSKLQALQNMERRAGNCLPADNERELK